MRFSLRSLLLLVAAASVSLALTRLEFMTGCFILVAIVTCSGFILSKSAWRFAVYGALHGMFCGYVAMLLYMLIDQGRVSGRTYAETAALFEIIHAWRCYIMDVGALVGATLGLMLYQKRAAVRNKSG